ncbi:MAG: DNA alkylation repair protein, partial [Clostridia bacterium]|nr:DNA alkylation repair protein [Clostridia bacterium]
MTPTEIREALFQLRDEEYRDFQAKLIPNVAPETMIGVRTPALRSLAKQLYRAGDYAAFLAELPHRCFDENQLHAFILSEMRHFEACLEA